MSVHATIYFRSGKVRDHDAPAAVDPEARFTFGFNFPRMVEIIDESARELGVPSPSHFIWDDPMDHEGELDTLTEEQFEALRAKHNATMQWFPIDQGIATFGALAAKHELDPEFGNPTEREEAIAFEVKCFHIALQVAAAAGEEAFHIQCN